MPHRARSLNIGRRLAASRPELSTPPGAWASAAPGLFGALWSPWLNPCAERYRGLSLPLPISARLDLLVALAERAGERTSRKEVVAACILGAPDGAEELVRWLHVYRRSPADSVYTSGSRLEDLELARARPGLRLRPWRQRSPAASP